jgi:CMP-N,N'-diacetyllegionaminic acid synthase
MKAVGIIGVRSQSKAIPHKNIQPLCGVPLIGWIIDAAKSARLLDRVIVTTDSPEYAEIARRFGAEAPFLRPPEISHDKALEIEYLQHALRWLRENENYEADIAVRLQATCPLQLPEDIDACVQKLITDPQADSAMVVAEALQHPLKAIRLVRNPGDPEGCAVAYESGGTRELTPFNRQSAEKVYFRANIIATRSRVLLEDNSQTGDKVRCHIIPQERAVDINVPLDLEMAGVLLPKFRPSIKEKYGY